MSQLKRAAHPTAAPLHQHTPPTHSINTLHQHTPSTHSINTLHQHTPSTYSINTLHPHTPQHTPSTQSTHSINTLHQHTPSYKPLKKAFTHPLLLQTTTTTSEYRSPHNLVCLTILGLSMLSDPAPSAHGVLTAAAGASLLKLPVHHTIALVTLQTARPHIDISSSTPTKKPDSQSHNTACYYM